MFTVVATKFGWNVYRAGKSEVLATFEKLATVKKTVESMKEELTVIINGYKVNRLRPGRRPRVESCSPAHCTPEGVHNE
jgi:hypothetical protein